MSEPQGGTLGETLNAPPSKRRDDVAEPGETTDSTLRKRLW
jgi:hypothetical protein